MNKVERKIYSFGLWLYGKTSGRNAFIWPTKYGRPAGEFIMASMVKRAEKRKVVRLRWK